jgi:hypothetical protein
MSLAARLHAQREAKKARIAAKPPKKEQTKIDPAWGYQHMQVTMARSSNTYTDQRDIDELTEGPLAQLEALRTGRLNDAGFLEIHEACMAACDLANDLYTHGTPSTKELLESLPWRDMIKAAGPALVAMKERQQKTGKFIAKADEINALREVIGGGGVYEQLIGIADRGAVCRALYNAAKSIRMAAKGKP